MTIPKTTTAAVDDAGSSPVAEAAANPSPAAVPLRKGSRIAKAAAPAASKRERASPVATAGKRAAPKARPAVRVEAVPAAVSKPHKPREKLVRDGFTMPETDFALIAVLKKRLLRNTREAKKSELLRAGLRALNALGDDALVVAFDELERIKTGRPKKGH